jgi:hypothetical protein
MEDVFRHLHISPELVCRFVAVFSRMEYALKSTRYAIGDEKYVEPAWDTFANDIDDAFFKVLDPEVVLARNYLLAHPPTKQTLAGNRVAFTDQTINTSQKQTQQLLLMVRKVRNNLFHGGKYLPQGEQETGRNHLLVQYALTVLLTCSKLDQEVCNSFEG